MIDVNLDSISVEPGRSGKGLLVIVVDIEVQDGELVKFDIGGPMRYHLIGERGYISAVSVRDDEADKFPHWPYPEPAIEAV
jgi:hypothetical protein